MFLRVALQWASPAVAGVAAMLFAYEPSLTPQNAQTLLEQTATDLGDTGWDSETGYGEVDAYHALQVLSARIDMESVPFAGSATLAIACDDGSSLPASEWSWTSSNPNVLAVDENTGTLTAKGRRLCYDHCYSQKGNDGSYFEGSAGWSSRSFPGCYWFNRGSVLYG